ncbi:MAG: hypothetical protein EXS36_06180 [Pedosphaera sp.]|nr:hypothetical protein [Pedosphaera sp.]
MSDNTKKSHELSDEQLEKIAGGERAASSASGGSHKIPARVPLGSSSRSSAGHYSSSSSSHR